MWCFFFFCITFKYDWSLFIILFPFFQFHVRALTISKLPLLTVNKPVINWEASTLGGPFLKMWKTVLLLPCVFRAETKHWTWLAQNKHETLLMGCCAWMVTNLMCFSVLFWMSVYVKSSPVFLALFSAVCVMLLKFCKLCLLPSSPNHSSIRLKELYMNSFGLTFFVWLWHMEEMGHNLIEWKVIFHSLSHFIAVGIILWNFSP